MAGSDAAGTGPAGSGIPRPRRGPVVVVGTVARDRVIHLAGPLVAGAKVAGAERGERLGGGAANAAFALALAGRAVRIAATVGSDGRGDRLLEELRAAGIDTSLVQRVPGASAAALVLIDPAGERTIVRLPPAQPARARGDFGSDPPAAVLARGDAPGLAALLEEAAATALVVAHIPPLAPGSRPAHVLVGSASDLPAALLADPVGAGRALAGAPLRWIVVTRGEAGAEAFGTAGERLAAPAPLVRVVDSTGAGDVFAAGLLDALLAGAPMERALRQAVAWGSAAVGWEGARPALAFPPAPRPRQGNGPE